MAAYILRQIPHELWARFKSRAQYEGIPMRALVLKLIEAYADGKVQISMEKSPTCRAGVENVFAPHRREHHD